MNRFKKLFYDSILFRLISMLVNLLSILILYMFFTIEVSLLITILLSISEIHKDLIDKVINK
jgi:hypothetical protein